MTDIPRLYALGFSCDEIATRHGLHPSTVRNILVKAGVKIRPHNGAVTSPLLTPAVLEQASNMLGEHPTAADLAEVAGKLDVPRRPLRRMLRIATRQINAPRAEWTGAEIGSLPPDHPFAKFDAAMAAARRITRYAYEAPPRASSIAACGEV